MRIVLTWLLFLGMIAGLQVRVLEVDPCELVAHHEHEHDYGHAYHPVSECDAPVIPCDPDHEDHCPPEHHHHHHGCYCPSQPLISTGDALPRLGCMSVTRSRLCHENERIPEGPVLGMDKPPLV